MKSLRSLTYLVVIVSFLAGCGSDNASGGSDTTADPAESAQDLTGTSWLLTSWSQDGEGQPATGEATLSFADDGELSGSTGCNRLAGTWDGADGALLLTIGPMTLMGCPDPGAQSQEQAVIAHLDSVTGYETVTDTLSLTDDSGETLLSYTAVSDELAGSSWRATGINNGNDAVVSDANTPSVTMEFGGDGAVGGNTGCNDYTATWNAEAGSISITDLTATEMSCGSEVDALESQYLAALAAATVYSVEGSGLELRDDAGALQVSFSRTG